MSRARHKRHHGHSAGGGSTHPAGTVQHIYSGADAPVMKEAHARKHGGRIHEGEGEEAKHHAGKRARGGAIKRKEGGSVIARKEGGAVPARKEGGAVAARKEGGSVIVRKEGGGVDRKDGGAIPARKDGGSVDRQAGGGVSVRAHTRSYGGRVPGRARGGGVEKHPLSSAANVKHLPETSGGHGGAGPANEMTDH